MNWQRWLDKFDELFASFARPYQMYICSTSIAVSLPLAIYIKSGEIAIGAIAASVAGLAGGTAVLRTVDIKTKAKAAATMAQVVTPAGSATVTQGVQSTPTQPKTAGMG